MDDILNLARRLAEAIENCESRRQYVSAKNKITKNQALLLKLQEFKRAQMDYQFKMLQNVHSTFDEERYVSKLYAELSLDDDARRFLESEREVLALIQQVQQIVSMSSGINMEF